MFLIRNEIGPNDHRMSKIRLAKKCERQNFLVVFRRVVCDRLVQKQDQVQDRVHFRISSLKVSPLTSVHGPSHNDPSFLGKNHIFVTFRFNTFPFQYAFVNQGNIF